jgi:hypothetical protein
MKKLLIVILFPVLLMLASCAGGYYGVGVTSGTPYYGGFYGPAYGGYPLAPAYGYHGHGGYYHGGYNHHGGHYAGGGNWHNHGHH